LHGMHAKAIHVNAQVDRLLLQWPRRVVNLCYLTAA